MLIEYIGFALGYSCKVEPILVNLVSHRKF